MDGPYAMLKEFARYAIVGGVAFLADFGTLVLVQETASSVAAAHRRRRTAFFIIRIS